jgi:hypothetical protein
MMLASLKQTSTADFTLTHYARHGKSGFTCLGSLVVATTIRIDPICCHIAAQVPKTSTATVVVFANKISQILTILRGAFL